MSNEDQIINEYEVRSQAETEQEWLLEVEREMAHLYGERAHNDC